MTIRIYPSRLPGEPLEIHEHSSITLYDWFRKNVAGWTFERDHPIAVEIDGFPVPVDEWPLCVIKPDSDVRLYPVPYATGAAIAAYAALAVAVAAAAYSFYMISTMDKGAGSRDSGNQLELNPAKANMPKLGDPVREIFGTAKVYPDYIMSPVSRFDSADPRKFITSLFLCVGVGNMSIPGASIRIGNTPIASFGDDVSYTVYPPGAVVTGDARTENWFNNGEVGSTTSGTSGLDLNSTGPQTVSINAEAVLVSNNTITLLDVSSSDDDDTEIPASWVVGTVITVDAPNSYTIVNTGGYSVIYGQFTELAPTTGRPVTLGFNDTDYSLFVASYVPAVAAIPGEGGSAASVTASTAPTTYNFTSAPVTFSITWSGKTYSVSLTTNYVNMSGLVNAVSSQITGSGLVARDNSGKLQIYEPSSPFAGGSIMHSALPVSAFGSTPVDTAGTKSTGGSAAVDAHITLAYTSATGKPFTGIPTGAQRLSIGYAARQFRITGIDDQTLTVERVRVTQDASGNDVVTVDSTWPGFTARTLLDARVTGVNDDYSWLGPFMACPDGEATTTIENNFIFPGGHIQYKKNGDSQGHSVQVLVQYRNAAVGGNWTQVAYSFRGETADGHGFTRRISGLPAAQYEVRVRRTTKIGGTNTVNNLYWQSLCSRLSKRPSRYNNVTTIALSVRTGNRLAAQSDRQVSCVPTGLYNGYPARSISGAFYHVLSSLGFSDADMDKDTVDALERDYWTPRGETFDFATTDSQSALEVLKKILEAGMGYLLLTDGQISAGREGIKPWVGMLTPQDTIEELQTTFKAPSKDDFDGVDVTYINGTTWAEETIQCRLPGNPNPLKIESVTLDGVTDPHRVYRWGMRRLMGHQLQRLEHSTSTELDALCYEFMDRIVLADDKQGQQQISCLILSMESDGQIVTLGVSEPLDWTFDSPRVILRFQDGKASQMLVPTRVGNYTLSVPYSLDLRTDEWMMDHPSIEPPELLFCSSVRIPYDALIREIAPDTDGTCEVSAIRYHPDKYLYDDALYPGDVA